MIDVLGPSTARLDLSRSVTLLEPGVERRNRQWRRRSEGDAEKAGDEESSHVSRVLRSFVSGGAARGEGEASTAVRSVASSGEPVVSVEPQPAQPLDDAETSSDGSGGEPGEAGPDGETSLTKTASPAESRGESSSRQDRPADRDRRRFAGSHPAGFRETSEEERSSSARRISASGRALSMAGFPGAAMGEAVEEGRAERRLGRTGFPRATPGEGSADSDWGSSTRARSRSAPPASLHSPSGFSGSPVRILSKPKPRYPIEAVKRRIEGDVLLDVEFRHSGILDVLGVCRGLGCGLNESAIEAARKIRFLPAQRDGLPVDVPACLRVRFQLTH